MHVHCPSRDELAGFSDGHLPEARFEVIAGHVSFCKSCQATLLDLTNSSDPLRQHLRAVAAATVSGRGEATAANEPPTCQSDVLLLFEDAAIGTFGGSPAVTERETPWDHLPDQLGQYRILEPLRSGGMVQSSRPNMYC